MAPNKNRNQGSTGQNKTAVSQDFRPLAPLGVTIERPWVPCGFDCIGVGNVVLHSVRGTV
jgi:hypothetical protein